MQSEGNFNSIDELFFNGTFEPNQAISYAFSWSRSKRGFSFWNGLSIAFMLGYDSIPSDIEDEDELMWEEDV